MLRALQTSPPPTSPPPPHLLLPLHILLPSCRSANVVLMLLQSRRSRWRQTSIVTLTVLVLISLYTLHTWPVTTKDVIPLQVPPSRTTTSAPETTPSVLAIPQKIWYKLDRRGVTKQIRDWVDSCLDKNPTYTSEFMTDLSSDAYVKKNFAHRPDIVDAFLELQFPILKADFLRYMLLFNEGGIYSDLDVSCGDTPIRDWIPKQYIKDASLVVGWEFDVGWGDSFTREFATWTIMARPGSPHLSMVIDDILVGLRQKTKEHNVTIADLTWKMVGDVVDLTGPRRMTRSILKSLKATLENFDEGSLASLPEPKLVGDVLILPGYSFALSSNHYKPEDKQGPALVTHHFDGSWKNDHGGQTADPVP